MNILLVVICSVALLVVGYIFYGQWLAKQWGEDPQQPTPAVEMEDQKDYVASSPVVVATHHFASIAGVGFIAGPIQAAIFGWVPVLLWLIIGAVFIGAAQDFGSLLASLRTKGATLVTVVAENTDSSAKRMFCIFAYSALILVIASFSGIVASTFAITPGMDQKAADLNSSVALVSVLFVFAAVAWAFINRKWQLPLWASLLFGFAIVAAIVTIAMGLPGILCLDQITWMVLIGLYILVAALVPVWMLLQPRDYLSTLLFAGILLLSVLGIIAASLSGRGFEGGIPAFTGILVTSQAFDTLTGLTLYDSAGKAIMNPAASGGFLFPALFITVACGAVSGFHSLVAAGSTSKQLAKESKGRPVVMGSMLLECALGILALIAVGFVWKNYAAGAYPSPMAVFADGIASMVVFIPGLDGGKDWAYGLLTLGVSAFCLTSLDTAARLGRYVFQEFWLAPGVSASQLKGPRMLLSNKYVATFITVVLGIGLGLTGFTTLWPLFGVVNQMLAAMALMTVACWLASAGRKNAMLIAPMIFMFAVSFVALGLIIFQNLMALISGVNILESLGLLLLASLLFALAVKFAASSAAGLMKTQVVPIESPDEEL